jgi:glycogen operon protein
VVRFKLPELVGGQTWRCLIDTNQPEQDETPRFESGEEYEVTGRSVLFFVLEPEGKPSVSLRRAARALREVAEAPTAVPPVAIAVPAEPEPEQSAEEEKPEPKS